MTALAVHITGASGSGVTTLGRALAEASGAAQLDTDDFYWAPVEPKFSEKRAPEERLQLIRDAMAAAGERGWVLSGSVGDWGDELVPLFQLVIFMSAPTAVRVARLTVREEAQFGAAAIAPGGARHENFVWFIDWASQYETGTREGRNRQIHEHFLARLSCPVLRFDGTRPTGELVAEALGALKALR
jgi:adenylate kinase family enzyme